MAAVGDSPRSALTAVGGQEVGTLRFEEPDYASSNWYFSREEIERNSPSRRDGIDSKKESYFRRSYCTFCQDVGMRLKVPQLTIATAIVFCHRFFLRQSHRLNDRFMIATICIFLAGKVEETPRPLKDVILVSYEVRHKKDPVALQKIKQKEVFEQQREMVLVGERLVLQTLGFDLNIHHPYKPLIAAVKKLGTAQSLLAQVAWNFVNDGLRTSLCLQFKPHHIAAGAIFLAAKFLKVKLPSEGDRTWWQEFGVTPKQLEEVSSQMLELYEHQGAAGGGGESTGPPGQAQSQAAQSQSVNQPSRAHIVQQSQPPPPPPPLPPPQPPQPTAPAALQLKPELQQQPRSPLRSRHKVVPVHASEPLLQFQDGRPARPISPAARAQANFLDAARENHQTPKGGVGCTPPGASLPPTSNGNALLDSKAYDRRDVERSRAPLENGVGERGSPRERVDTRRWKPYKKPEEEGPVRRDPEDGLPEVSPQLPRGKPPVDADRVVKVHGERVEVDDAGDRGQGFPEERGEVQNRIDPGSEEDRNEKEPEENEEEMWELIEQVEVNDGPKKPRGKKNPDKRRLPGVVKSKELLEMVSPRRRRVSGMELKKEDEEEDELGGKKRGEDGEEMKKDKASPRMEAAAEKRKSADVTEGREREKVEEGELPTLVVAKERRGGTASASDGSPARPSPSDASGRSRDRGGYHSSSRYDRHYYGRDHYHRHAGHGGGGGPGLGGGAGSAYRYRHGDGVDRDRVDRHRHRDREWPGDVEDHRHKKGRYEH